jgi:hypothetical protein
MRPCPAQETHGTRLITCAHGMGERGVAARETRTRARQLALAPVDTSLLIGVRTRSRHLHTRSSSSAVNAVERASRQRGRTPPVERIAVRQGGACFACVSAVPSVSCSPVLVVPVHDVTIVTSAILGL